MPEKKYIKQIKLGSDSLNIKDTEAVSSINGYANSSINDGSVTFANTPIPEADIDDILDDGQLNDSASGN